MGRAVLFFALAAIGGFMLVQWFTGADRRKVERLVVHMARVAEEGGPDAAAEILDVLADDYTGSLSRRNIERMVKSLVERDRVEKVILGNFKVIAGKGGLYIPLLRITVESGSMNGTALLEVHFENIDGRWVVTEVNRAKFGR